MLIIDAAGNARTLTAAEEAAVLRVLTAARPMPATPAPAPKRYYVIDPDGPEREVSAEEATELLRRADGFSEGYNASQSIGPEVLLYPKHPNVAGERYGYATSRADAYKALAADIADAPTYRARIERALAWLSIYYSKAGVVPAPGTLERLERAGAWLKATCPETP